MIEVGAFFFGLVVGWITYRTLRNSTVNGVNDIAAVIAAVGGAAVLAIFPQGTISFGAYCIGLALGFFGYLITAIVLAWTSGDAEARTIEWLGTRAGTNQHVQEPDPLPPDAE